MAAMMKYWARIATRAEVEVFPEVETIKLDTLEIEDIPTEVEDREVNDAVDQFLYQRSELRPISRPAELGDILYINCRNYVGGKRRAVARSRDQGQTFGPLEWDETLIEPICQASLERLPDGKLLFANPAILVILISFGQLNLFRIDQASFGFFFYGQTLDQ